MASNTKKEKGRKKSCKILQVLLIVQRDNAFIIFIYEYR